MTKQKICKSLFGLSCPKFVVGHPPFDKLRVTIVMVSLSNYGFPPEDCGNDGTNTNLF